jgi:hypothetical protein
MHRLRWLSLIVAVLLSSLPGVQAQTQNDPPSLTRIGLDADRLTKKRDALITHECHALSGTGRASDASTSRPSACACSAPA